MRVRFYVFYIISFFIFSTHGISQVDSLLNLYENENTDSVKINLLLQIGWVIIEKSPDSALYYANQAEELIYTVKNPYQANNLYRLKAFCYGDKNNRPKCLSNHLKRLDILESINDKSSHLAGAYFEMAAVLGSQGQIETANTYYEKCKALALELDLKTHYGMSLVNQSSFKQTKGKYEEAKKDLKLAYDTLINHDSNLAIYAYSQLAELYIKQDSFEIAEELVDTALTYEITDFSEIIGFLYAIKGEIATHKNDPKTAVNYYNISRLNWESQNKYFYLQGLYKKLADSYAEINLDSAIVYYQKYIELKDQALSEDNNSQIAEMEAKFNTAKKEKEIALLSKENEISELENKKQSQINTITLISLVIVLALMIFLASRVQLIRKQKFQIENRNKKITQQKELVEQKSKELTDSITYAKRIQNAILPPLNTFQEFLPNSFILYKPKDIVAGDFYWLHSDAEGILFAAADCTGHGVPGAMVSVICNNGLNRSVREYSLKSPSKILDKTREIVVEEFEKSEENVKDGMDIALCRLEGNTLYYSGAHNPLWIIRKNIQSIEEIKANKQPIGQFDKVQPYQLHKIKLDKGDCIYIFSDGFADQFGGERGKKFKTSNFKKLLLSIQNLDMVAQKIRLNEAFENWKGQTDQIDDVCVIGVKV